MTIKVKMIPHVSVLGDGASGIHTLVRKWFEHLPKYGVELVGPHDDGFDVLAVHAGMGENLPGDIPLVSHTHGLYWTADYNSARWEKSTNANVVEACRKANVVTVPSRWVGEAFQRDMRLTPVVVPHGIDWQEWQHDKPNEGYILAYAKNRAYDDVCSPTFVTELAKRFPDKKFVATYAPKGVPPNVLVVGTVPPATMKNIIQRSALVLSPIKETFGILTLEAMASGVPVLGYAHGGNMELIVHQITGYLAAPNNPLALYDGLEWCLKHRDVLSVHAREFAKLWTWDAVCQQLTGIYQGAMTPEPPTVAVVIPSYNYSGKVSNAIQSVLEQTYLRIIDIVVVDDGSVDDGATEAVVRNFTERDSRVRYYRQDNAGVACARNAGISRVTAKYVLCLDADDRIQPQYIEACVAPLEKDRSLGIAYTGLMTCTADGKQTVSPWPGKFDYNAQIARRNQVPTACLFRREAWVRVGGYRQRYAPHGCGSEDADFWTRIGAAGYGAIQATEAPLFLYSFGQGQVSGNKNYHEVDWLALHPWVKDGQHPFASVATPKTFSHPVRQYDEPVISVIIPVGPGHKSQVFNALDSLEAQTLRKWEVVLVDDTGDPGEIWAFDGVENALAAYPYVRLVDTPGKQGAGYARNRGVEAARAPLIVFLDADDNFFGNDALALMLDAWRKTGEIIYTDYVSKAYVDEQEAQKLNRKGVLLDYNPKLGLVMYQSQASDYDCARAVAQPANPLYIWNLITSLLPKKFHFEIGGFDEKMQSWEDWDYWLRLARAGKCFTRLTQPLVCYRFYTGTRRETGIQVHQNLLQYLLQKYEGVKPMACGCSKKKVTVVSPTPPAPQSQAQQVDNGMVLVTLIDPNRGEHRVVGQAVFAEQYGPFMIPVEGGWSFDYQRHSAGEQFYVHQADIALQPHIFLPAPQQTPDQVAAEVSKSFADQPVVPDEPPPAPRFDPQAIPGVTRAIAEQIIEKGYDSLECLVELGEEGLLKLEGMTEKRARTILAGVKKMQKKADPISA